MSRNDQETAICRSLFVQAVAKVALGAFHVARVARPWAFQACRTAPISGEMGYGVRYRDFSISGEMGEMGCSLRFAIFMRRIDSSG